MRTEPRPMRVLMVLEAAFPSPSGGGAESQVRTLALGLRARGQRVTVLTPLLRRGPQQRISRVGNIVVCRLPYPRVRYLGGPLLWLRLTGFLHRRRNRYDVWHVHIAHHLGAVCALLGHWQRIPVVVKVSGWWELERGTLAPDAGPLTRVAYRCLLHAYAWQAISQRIATALVAKGVPAERIAAVPNAVDTTRFRAITRIPEATTRFIYLGRLAEEKGLRTLLAAFAELLAAHPQASLVLVGTGALRDQLDASATALGIAARVEFVGHRDDIETLLGDADIGILPSRIEGLSNALLECMAAGLPMIASRISGNEDFVRPGENGWLFEPDDRADLLRCLRQAAALTPERRLALGTNARATVERQASLPVVLDRLLALYRTQPALLSTVQPAARSP